MKTVCATTPKNPNTRINIAASIGPMISLVKTAIFTFIFLKSNSVLESFTPNVIRSIFSL